MRRACASIPTNIAEGCGRNTEADLARFIDIAAGSTSEVEYQLHLARDLGYLTIVDHDGLSDEVRRIRKMLVSFSKSIREKA
jgi:four helix bundle protein